MARYLGDVWQLTGRTYDVSGSPANATTVTCTVRQPDGTTVPTGAPANPSTGVYVAAFTPTQAGMHSAVFTATGANASVGPVDFYVHPPAGLALVTLDEARAHLNRTSTTGDDELRGIIDVASAACERWTDRYWRRRTVVATLDGGGSVLLRADAIAVTTVTDAGLAVTGWTLRSPGILAPAGGRWVGPVVVTYSAGPADGLTPEPIRQGVLELVRHLWDTQRGGSNLPRQGGVDDVYGARDGYALPRRVLELWEPYAAPAAVA